MSKVEAANDYDKDMVVLTFGEGQWRIINCRDNIQWILQKRFQSTKGGNKPWRSLSFHRHLSELIRDVRSRGATAEDLAVLEALPPLHP